MRLDMKFHAQKPSTYTSRCDTGKKEYPDEKCEAIKKYFRSHSGRIVCWFDECGADTGFI